MKRYTLLEVVQEAGRAIGADEIDTLDESVEAVDLAGLAVATLNDIIGRQAWEFLSDRVVTPTTTDNFVFALPQDVLEVLEVYATSATQKDQTVSYSMPQFFVRRASLNTSGTSVTIPNTGALTLAPTGIPAKYTSFDEKSIVLLNNDPLNIIKVRVRVTLDLSGAGSHSLGYVPTWVPDIPLRMFNYWVCETCAAASSVLRQVQDQRLEGMAQRAYEALIQNPAMTRLESQQRKFSSLMDERIQQRGTVPQRQNSQGGQQ